MPAAAWKRSLPSGRTWPIGFRVNAAGGGLEDVPGHRLSKRHEASFGPGSAATALRRLAMPPRFRTVVFHARLLASAVPARGLAASISSVRSADRTDPDGTSAAHRRPATGPASTRERWRPSPPSSRAPRCWPSATAARCRSPRPASSRCAHLPDGRRRCRQLDRTMRLRDTRPATFDTRATFDIGARGVVVVATGVTLAQSAGAIKNDRAAPAGGAPRAAIVNNTTFPLPHRAQAPASRTTGKETAIVRASEFR